jgi:hypothetical protein
MGRSIYNIYAEFCFSPHHQFRSILQCFRQMYALDFVTPRQIRDCARQLQNAMISTRRKIVLSHRRPRQTLVIRQAQHTAFILLLAKLLYLLAYRHYKQYLTSRYSRIVCFVHLLRLRLLPESTRPSPLIGRLLTFRNPRVEPLCEFQCGPAMDRRFVSDVS